VTADRSTRPIAVIGGVYRERCMHPHWDEVFGSAGRAASIIARLGATVALHTHADLVSKEVLDSRGAMEGFDVHASTIDRSLEFEYRHGLAAPKIYDRGDRHAPLNVRVERAVRYGMLEAEAIVHGDRVVYDPQNAIAPTRYHENGSTARELAIVMNRHEACVFTGLWNATTAELATALIAQKTAGVVVIKQGPAGALVHDGRRIQIVPAYRSRAVWKIGSGDNFGAHFAYRWLHEDRPAAESADMASRATAYYCETRGFPSHSNLANYAPTPITPSASHIAGRQRAVYLAGPFFTLAQLWLIEEARTCLRSMGLAVFSPYHDVGHGSADDVVTQDLAAIDAADLIFAIGDGMDPGTVFEVGHAKAKGKPVVLYGENVSAGDQKMMLGSGCVIADDFVSAIYEAAWVACTL